MIGGQSFQSLAGDVAFEPELPCPSLTQLRAFTAAARLGSISAAAGFLRRSQSAVSQAIRNLEVALGARLFSRGALGSSLTADGAILHRRSENCLRLLEAGLLGAAGDAQGRPTEALLARLTRTQLLALVAVHEYGSFGEAARHLRISQSSLHRGARALEQHLGVPLLAPTGHGVTTNAAGTRLAGTMLLALRELKCAGEEIRARQGLLSGRLQIGAMMLAGTPFLSSAVGSFLRQHPGVGVSMVSGNYEALLAKLLGGSVDFIVGLLKSPRPAGDLVTETLSDDPYVIAADRCHPLAGGSHLDPGRLRGSEWIGAAARWHVVQRLIPGHSLPPLRVETQSLPAIFLLLKNSQRLSVLTRTELALARELGTDLVALDIQADKPQAEIGVVMRRSWQTTQIQRAFLDTLRQAVPGACG